jgi:murein DD-endopeptidase MepM/ murein hydrolase activator NlpD
VTTEWQAGLRPLGAFGVAAGILAAAAAYGIQGEWPWPPSTVVPARHLDGLTAQLDTLREGETVSDLFSRQGLPRFTLSQASSLALFDPRRLRSGLVFSFLRRKSDSIPHLVVLNAGTTQRVSLRLAPDGWEAIAEPIAWHSEEITFEGRINTTLFDALNDDVNNELLAPEDRVRLAWDMADVFAWQVDFTRDLRPGDSFRVVAERLIAEDGLVRYGRVLAGDLEVGGRRYTAFRWTSPDGRSGFFDADGHSLRRDFLLTPVAFRRISSVRSAARLHPILGIVRRHEGIDYVADPGTPVMAAGDGVIVHRGWTGGYGYMVEIRHRHGIVTRYGHLQDFAKGITTGVPVTQGEVIGYVGSSGLATGPHLHYEFRVNGAARDPRSSDMGTGDPVPLAQRREFDFERARLSALLADAPPAFAVAGFGREPGGQSGIGASF